MTTLYYDLALPNKECNVDISTFLTPCTNKSSAWWDSLSIFDYGAKSIKEWLSMAVKSRQNWAENHAYTMRVCPGVGDLFKRSYLVKWPCDAALNVQNVDGDYAYFYKTSDGSLPALVHFDFHHEDQYRNTNHQIYDNMFNVKLCLPVDLFSKKTVSVMTVNPDYHLNSVPYKVMPGVINYTPTMVHELNINLMFPIPSDNSEYTLEFKAGDPICYLTVLNYDKSVRLEQKQAPYHYRKKFLRGGV